MWSRYSPVLFLYVWHGHFNFYIYRYNGYFLYYLHLSLDFGSTPLKESANIVPCRKFPSRGDDVFKISVKFRRRHFVALTNRHNLGTEMMSNLKINSGGKETLRKILILITAWISMFKTDTILITQTTINSFFVHTRNIRHMLQYQFPFPPDLDLNHLIWTNSIWNCL